MKTILSPTTPTKSPAPTTVPASGRRETLTLAHFKALTASKPTSKVKTKSGPPKPPTTQEIKARAQLAKVGRYAGSYEAQPARRYVLRDDEEARRLDAAFYEITQTQP